MSPSRIRFEFHMRQTGIDGATHQPNPMCTAKFNLISDEKIAYNQVDSVMAFIKCRHRLGFLMETREMTECVGKEK